VINWTDVAPALVTLFSDLALDNAATPAFKAQWADKQREFIHPAVGKSLILRVSSIAGVGGDERRYENITITPEDADPYTMVRETIVGHRRFVVEVRVESHDHTENESRWCWSMTERIRTRLRRQRSLDALQAVNVAMLDIGPATDVSLTYDKRRVNAAVLDVSFYAAFSDADPVPLNWFARVLLTSDVDESGEPPNVTDLSIPEP
jgi:hypothetical protein